MIFNDSLISVSGTSVKEISSTSQKADAQFQTVLSRVRMRRGLSVNSDSSFKQFHNTVFKLALLRQETTYDYQFKKLTTYLIRF